MWKLTDCTILWKRQGEKWHRKAPRRRTSAPEMARMMGLLVRHFIATALALPVRFLGHQRDATEPRDAKARELSWRFHARLATGFSEERVLEQLPRGKVMTFPFLPREAKKKESARWGGEKTTPFFFFCGERSLNGIIVYPAIALGVISRLRNRVGHFWCRFGEDLGGGRWHSFLGENCIFSIVEKNVANYFL